MPLESEHTDSASVVFTPEGEIALEREVKRFERKLRAAAIEASIRVRGFPAEVTSTDVSRSARQLSRLRPLGLETDDPLRRAFHINEMGRVEAISASPDKQQNEALEKRWRRTAIYRLFTIYAWLGMLTTVVGILYPIMHDSILNMLRSPLWRQGLLIAGTGLLLGVLAFGARSQFRRSWTLRFKRR